MAETVSCSCNIPNNLSDLLVDATYVVALQAVTRVAWSASAPLVATGCVDGVVRLWDLRTAACVKQLHGHKQAVQDLTLSPDGTMLLSGADDAVARVFSIA